MIVQLVSQIDINHWTVLFLDGEWKDQKGDYRIVSQLDMDRWNTFLLENAGKEEKAGFVLEKKSYDDGQKVEVDVIPNKKHPVPTVDGYCGTLVVKGSVTDTPIKKVKKCSTTSSKPDVEKKPS